MGSITPTADRAMELLRFPKSVDAVAIFERVDRRPETTVIEGLEFAPRDETAQRLLFEDAVVVR